MLLASTAAPAFAQKRRIPVSSARPTATNRNKSKSSTEAERERERRLKAARQDGQIGETSDEQGVDGEIVGTPTLMDEGIPATSRQIMAEQRLQKTTKPNYRSMWKELEDEKLEARKNRPAAPGTQALSQWPQQEESGPNFAKPDREITPSAPQVVSTNFDGATSSPTNGPFPPDTMGAVGPSQYFVFVNGRLRTFNKATGVADGVINADPDVFFSSVLTTPGANEVVFTSDPNVRYDRLSGRWFLTIIDVPLNLTTFLSRANRILIAVSDAASSNAITASTVWTFYQFTGDTRFSDYPSLGIDAHALYIGTNQFSVTTGGLSNVRAHVIPKAAFLNGTTPTVFSFNNLLTGTSFQGPWSPRGVDNPVAAATTATSTGYFVGIDFAAFNVIAFRRVTNPGAISGSPTISANIRITTPLTTNYPILVPHLGNTVTTDTNADGFQDGYLDALDDRLFAAIMRNNRLWTSHAVATNSAGVSTPGAGTATDNRNSARWYEIDMTPATPTFVQSGTVYDNSATNPRYYWIPSMTVSGQGHAAIGTSIAGNTERINAFTTGRLAGDALGTMRDGPGKPPGYTNTSGSYNPPGDTGGDSGRRWGDYSFTSVDPKDDMTIWTIQEYCSADNVHSERVAKLLAPLPATPSSASNPVRAGRSSFKVTITGTSTGGTGFYDPGPDLAAPAVPFNHISATVTGGVTVNSVTYVNPTTVVLDLNTTAATTGLKNVTITNPDGQSNTGTSVINVLPGFNASQLLISEFRAHGQTGANDEYVELYNNTDAPLDITGIAIAALNGGVPAVAYAVPTASTILPARGHYLVTGSAYSLAGYSASDATLAVPLNDNVGLAVFDSSNLAEFNATHLLDAVGFSNITDPLYQEGGGLAPSGGITVDGEYSFVRRQGTATGGLPQDTGNNAADFAFVSTTAGTFSGVVSTLGAPGPENRNDPTRKAIALLLLDPPNTNATANRERNAGAVGPNAPQGTLTIRRTWTNNTGTTITRLRYRIGEITTTNSPLTVAAPQAEVRLINSGSSLVPTSTAPAGVAVEGTTVETPPAQALGGGLNTTAGRSLISGTITNTPIANGQSINVQFVLGVVQLGNFRFYVSIEALP
jgi:hypothetical protein